MMKTTVKTKVIKGKEPRVVKRGNDNIQRQLRDCASNIECVCNKMRFSGMNCVLNVFDNWVIEVSTTIWPKEEVEDALKRQSDKVFDILPKRFAPKPLSPSESEDKE